MNRLIVPLVINNECYKVKKIQTGIPQSVPFHIIGIDNATIYSGNTSANADIPQHIIPALIWFDLQGLPHPHDSFSLITKGSVPIPLNKARNGETTGLSIESAPMSLIMEGNMLYVTHLSCVIDAKSTGVVTIHLQLTDDHWGVSNRYYGFDVREGANALVTSIIGDNYISAKAVIYSNVPYELKDLQIHGREVQR